MSLTRRQRQILDYVRDFIERKRYAPSIEEIGKQFGLKSTATVHKHLKNLEERGVIRRDWNRSRSIEVMPEESQDRSVTVRVEFELRPDLSLGSCAEKQRIAVPVELVQGGRAFVVAVRGDSFNGLQIRDGDYLLLLERPDPPSGSTVLVWLREEQVGLRKLFRDGTKLRLFPLDGQGPPQVVNEALVRMAGVLSALIRRY